MKKDKAHTSPIQYGTLSNNLKAMGFSETIFPASHILLENKKAGVVFMLPVMKAADTVRQIHLAALKSHLVGKGIITAEDFDLRMHLSPVASVEVKLLRAETSSKRKKSPGVARRIMSPVNVHAKAK